MNYCEQKRFELNYLVRLTKDYKRNTLRLRNAWKLSLSLTPPRNLQFAFHFTNSLWALRNTQQYEHKSFFYIEWKLIETDRFMCLEIASRKFCCMCCQEIKNIFVSAFRTLLVRIPSQSMNKQRCRWNSRNRDKIVLSI